MANLMRTIYYFRANKHSNPMIKNTFIIFFLFCSGIAFCQYHAEQKNEKWGILSEKGEEVLPFEYTEISPVNYSSLNVVTNTYTAHSDEYFLLNKDGKWGIYNAPAKKFLLDLKYQEVIVDYGLGGNYLILAAKLKDKYALFYPNGSPMTGFEFKGIDTGDFFGNSDSIVAYVSKSGKKYVTIDKNGKLGK